MFFYSILFCPNSFHDLNPRRIKVVIAISVSDDDGVSAALFISRHHSLVILCEADVISITTKDVKRVNIYSR